MTILRRENVLILKAFNYKLVQNNHCILFFLQVLNHILYLKIDLLHCTFDFYSPTWNVIVYQDHHNSLQNELTNLTTLKQSKSTNLTSLWRVPTLKQSILIFCVFKHRCLFILGGEGGICSINFTVIHLSWIYKQMYRRLSMNRYEKNNNSGSIILLYTIFPEQLNLNWLIGVIRQL